MPYVDSLSREKYLSILDEIDALAILHPGELNYLITMICLSYIDDHGEQYQTFNDIVGALENAKQELYRRVVVNYEDLKKKENGDVY